MLRITIEDLDGNIINAELITFSDLNSIARKNCMGLTYLMSVMDANSNYNTCYMWFKDDRTGENYLVEEDN